MMRKFGSVPTAKLLLVLSLPHPMFVAGFPLASYPDTRIAYWLAVSSASGGLRPTNGAVTNGSGWNGVTFPLASCRVNTTNPAASPRAETTAEATGANRQANVVERATGTVVYMILYRSTRHCVTNL